MARPATALSSPTTVHRPGLPRPVSRNSKFGGAAPIGMLSHATAGISARANDQATQTQPVSAAAIVTFPTCLRALLLASMRNHLGERALRSAWTKAV